MDIKELLEPWGREARLAAQVKPDRQEHLEFAGLTARTGSEVPPEPLESAEGPEIMVWTERTVPPVKQGQLEVADRPENEEKREKEAQLASKGPLAVQVQ